VEKLTGKPVATATANAKYLDRNIFMATVTMPPCPIAIASVAAHRRRPRSSRSLANARYLIRRSQLQFAKKLHQKDLSEGFGEVFLPNALEKKYPNLNRERGWQYLFPDLNLSVDPRSGIRRRHHVLERPMIYTHVLNRGGRGVRSPLDECLQ
jgi:hypothetical protein